MNKYILAVVILMMVCLSAITSASDAVIGNQNPYLPPSLTGIFDQYDAVTLVSFGPTIDECPERGFVVDSVSILLDFPEAMVGSQIACRAALNFAHTVAYLGMAYYPLSEYCSSEVMNYTVQTSGIQTVVIPFPPSIPVQIGEPYHLIMHFDGAISANLPTDSGGYTYFSYLHPIGSNDNFWEYGPSRSPIIWADVTCGTPPIPVESPSWGAIKSMYR